MKVHVIGQGRPLLYLHDWGFNSEAWNRQIDFFRGGHSNWLVDYNLERPPPELTYDTLLDHLCRQLLPRLELEAMRPAAILAAGLGAFLAYELIDRGVSPHGLVLFGGLVRYTNGEGFLSGLEPERVAAMRRRLRENPRRMLSGYYRFVFSGEGESPPPELADCMPLNAVTFLQLAFDTLISHDYQALVRHLPCPALIVQGDADRISSLYQGQMLRRLLPDSQMLVFKGAGHAPHVTHYAAVNRGVAHFLADVAARSE